MFERSKQHKTELRPRKHKCHNNIAPLFHYHNVWKFHCEALGRTMYEHKANVAQLTALPQPWRWHLWMNIPRVGVTIIDLIWREFWRGTHTCANYTLMSQKWSRVCTRFASQTVLTVLRQIIAIRVATFVRDTSNIIPYTNVPCRYKTTGLFTTAFRPLSTSFRSHISMFLLFVYTELAVPKKKNKSRTDL